MIAIAGTTIALEPVDRPAVTWLPEFVDGTFLTFSHQNSLIALKGALLQRGTIGDLRFKVTGPTREDRRKSWRIGVCLTGCSWTPTRRCGSAPTSTMEVSVCS